MSEERIDQFQSIGLKDSDALLRVAPPSSPAPLEPLRLRLKQVAVDQVPISEREVLAMFASFGDQWQRERASVENRAHSTLRDLLGSDHSYEVITETARNRRFSGDGSLRRKKYFSVCESGSDDDQGTMLRELLSYHDASKHGAAEITETAGSPGEMEIALSRYACEPPIASNRRAQFRRTSYRIPIRVLDEEFERVIDLRRPSTAEWFTSNLTRLRWLTGGDDEQLAFPRKAPLDRFHELLPSLVTQARGGGNGATRIAGAWLRALGADGLVFPSARSDAMLEADRGETLDFRGWSFVDYRGEPPPRALTVDFTSEWSRVALRNGDEGDANQEPLMSDTGLEWVETPTGVRWAWRGLEEANQAYRELAAALHAYEWIHGSDRRASQLLLQVLVGDDARARDTRVRSFALVLAFEGHQDARRAISQRVSTVLEDEEARTLGLGTAFRRMDDILAG